MGSLAAGTIENWLLQANDVNLVTSKVTEKDVAGQKVRGWLEQSDHFVIEQKRRFVNLVEFTDSTGDTSTSFTWQVGPGNLIGFTRVGRIDAADQYVCTKDRIEIDDHITGSGWQMQIWELQSKTTPVAASYFEEAVT
ncbi:MAG: hypothetical protein HQ559_07305 [Lentisphaerae bacterium]|nr:hypothetical protein [Lentisphaerota bacterium]